MLSLKTCQQDTTDSAGVEDHAAHKRHLDMADAITPCLIGVEMGGHCWPPASIFARAWARMRFTASLIGCQVSGVSLMRRS
jgi:hypothetical protein